MICQKLKNGFTLIELLIVVAIIAILATIAVPNFMEAQTRSKVARAKADMRTMATALEGYATDNKGYPPLPMGLPGRFRRFIPLTTPIQYLSTIPRDPFQSIDVTAATQASWRVGMYAYSATPLENASRWALASDGPDRQSDVNSDDVIRGRDFYYPGYSSGLFSGKLAGYDYVIYDPTNGAVSRGDVFRASDYVPN